MLLRRPDLAGEDMDDGYGRCELMSVARGSEHADRRAASTPRLHHNCTTTALSLLHHTCEDDNLMPPGHPWVARACNRLAITSWIVV